jgi:hypothetical protein
VKKVLSILIIVSITIVLSLKFSEVQEVCAIAKKTDNITAYKNKHDMKDKLKSYNYEIFKSVNKDVKDVYLISDNGKSLTFTRYLIKNNGDLNIVLPHNKNFIISLQANSVVAAKWKFSDVINKSGLKLVGEELIDIVDDYQKNNPGSTGYSATRQFFYLCSKNVGSSSSKFNYLSTSDNRNFFKFKLNIKTTK